MMGKRRHEQEKQSAYRGRRWPLVIVVLVIAAGIVMMVLPRNSGGGNNTMTVGPRFTKHGQVAIVHRDGTVAATVDVEIAETPQKRQDGLMGRPALEERQGMFFIFEYEQPLGFWMKNTILPLDMFFINAQNEITTIHRNTVPYSEETYPSRGPARYVLELNAGFADRNGIVEGDKIQLTR